MGDKMTWRKLIESTMKNHGDSWENVESVVVDGNLDDEFDCGFGGEQGCPFTVWTTSHVYFPMCYDGAEWAGFAPRNPDGKALRHQGG